MKRFRKGVKAIEVFVFQGSRVDVKVADEEDDPRMKGESDARILMVRLRILMPPCCQAGICLDILKHEA